MVNAVASAAIRAGTPWSTAHPASALAIESEMTMPPKSADRIRPRNLSSLNRCNSVVEKTHAVEDPPCASTIPISAGMSEGAKASIA
jgi:hypothetical protein